MSSDPELHRTLQAPVVHQHPEADHPGAGLVSPPQGTVSADAGLKMDQDFGFATMIT